MKGPQVNAFKDDELLQKLSEVRQEAFNLRFQHATGELENTARLGQVRRDIARLLSVARQRGLNVSGALIEE